jgi:hypothetical protein
MIIDETKKTTCLFMFIIGEGEGEGGGGVGFVAVAMDERRADRVMT